jgi:2-phospho-L-lactate guanylyltransferase
MVVPLRSFRDGKTRLAPVLDEGQRAALVEWLLVRTLETAAAFPGLESTAVVTGCRDAAICARRLGARVLSDEGIGLNGALARAQAAVAALGASRMLVVSSDLPRLNADDLRRLAAAPGSAVALAPDGGRQGTNGLCVPASRPFGFSFGPASFTRHLDRVRALDLEAVVVDRPGLAFDVDLPAHLFECEELLPASLGLPILQIRPKDHANTRCCP